MATKIKDAAVVTSKYTSNGSEKAHWTNVGALYRKDDGSEFLRFNAFFNLAALPRNDGSEYVIIPLFEHKQRENQSSTNNSSSFSRNDNFAYSSDSNEAEVPF